MFFAQEDVKNTTVVETSLTRGYIRSAVTMLCVTNRNDKAKEILFELQLLSTEQFYFN